LWTIADAQARESETVSDSLLSRSSHNTGTWLPEKMRVTYCNATKQNSGTLTSFNIGPAAALSQQNSASRKNFVHAVLVNYVLQALERRKKYTSR
jgi:hypothetical protein